jgi:hypothetical protein
MLNVVQVSLVKVHVEKQRTTLFQKYRQRLGNKTLKSTKGIDRNHKSKKDIC